MQNHFPYTCIPDIPILLKWKCLSGGIPGDICDTVTKASFLCLAFFVLL